MRRAWVDYPMGCRQVENLSYFHPDHRLCAKPSKKTHPNQTGNRLTKLQCSIEILPNDFMASFSFTRPLFVKLGILAVGFVVATLQLVFGFEGVDLRCFGTRVLGFSNPCIEQGAMLAES